MTRSRVTTPPARRCIGDGSDEAIRVCALKSRCQVRSEPAWVARMDSRIRSMSVSSTAQERGRWVLKCRARRHEPMHRRLLRHVGSDGYGESADSRGFT